MRVLYFSRAYTTHDRLFMATLVDAGHQVSFLQLEDDGISYEGRDLPIGVQRLPQLGCHPGVTDYSALEEFVPELRKRISLADPEVVHAGPVQTCGYLVSVTNFHPFVLMSWGYDLLVDSERSARDHWVSWKVLASADYLVCDCETVRQKALSFCVSCAERAAVFPWGTDIGSFRPDAGDTLAQEIQARLGWKDRTIVFTNRTWDTIYGIDVLLRAFSMAQRSRPALALVLAADGPLAEYVDGFINSEHIGDVVHRPGRIPAHELPSWYRASDIYMSCSVVDGSSVSLLEAMASGIPVLVSDILGNAEWVEDSISGHLVQPDGVREFSKRLVALESMGVTRRQDMGHRGRSIAEARADWTQNSQRLVQLYHEIAGALQTLVCAPRSATFL